LLQNDELESRNMSKKALEDEARYENDETDSLARERVAALVVSFQITYTNDCACTCVYNS
jgi:hypothetical protein